MNIAKNMEIIFIAALHTDAAAPMTVVTITGKRMSAAQKVQPGA